MSGALVLMCGLSFSGKSTVASAIADALGAETVSLDDINDERGFWGGHGILLEEWQRTHEIARLRTEASLTRGEIVVLDDTSNLRQLRDGWRDLAATCDASFLLLLVSAPLETIRSRIDAAARTGARRGVSEEVFARHAISFEPPDDDEEPFVVSPADSLDRVAADVRTRLGY